MLISYKDLTTDFLQMRFLIAKKYFEEKGFNIQRAYVRCDIWDILLGLHVGFSRRESWLHGVFLEQKETMRSFFELISEDRGHIVKISGTFPKCEQKRCPDRAHPGLNYCLYHSARR